MIFPRAGCRTSAVFDAISASVLGPVQRLISLMVEMIKAFRRPAQRQTEAGSQYAAGR